jgi:hypothetical protein
LLGEYLTVGFVPEADVQVASAIDGVNNRFIDTLGIKRIST